MSKGFALLAGIVIVTLIWALGAHAQLSFPPTPMAVYASADGGTTWNPYSGVGGGTPLPFTPPPFGAYCSADAGVSWLPCSFGGGGGGSGTVTNVAWGTNAALGALFTCTVASPTTAAIINCTLANAAQNSVLAGPPSGGAGAWSFQTAPTFSAANLTNIPACATCATSANNLSFFAATTSAQLASVISNETGTGLLVFGTNPVLTTPNLGVPSAVTLTNGLGLPLGGLIAGTAPASSGVYDFNTGNDLVLRGLLTENLTGASLPSMPANTILSVANVSGSLTRVVSSSFGSTAFFSTVAAAGTAASPTAILAGTQIGGINGWAYNGAAYNGPIASMRIFANENQGAGNAGSYISFVTTSNGSTTAQEIMRLENDGGITCPATVTGGDKGFSTINCAGLYQNGVQALDLSSVATVTNKRITKRVSALSANSATPAVNTDNFDVVHITAQTATITGFTMTGTPVDGDTLRISITGTASVPFTLGSSFEASGGVPLSTTTSSTARLDMGFVWNTETSKWRQVAAE